MHIHLSFYCVARLFCNCLRWIHWNIDTYRVEDTTHTPEQHASVVFLVSAMWLCDASYRQPNQTNWKISMCCIWSIADYRLSAQFTKLFSTEFYCSSCTHTWQVANLKLKCFRFVHFIVSFSTRCDAHCFIDSTAYWSFDKNVPLAKMNFKWVLVPLKYHTNAHTHTLCNLLTVFHPRE